MSLRPTSLALGIAALLLLSASTVSADPIGPTCPNNSCNGGIYTLFYSGFPVSTTATTSTYRVTETIDTSALTIAAVTISDVAVKVSSSVVGASLFSTPAGTWTVSMEGLNANGCGGGGSGFVCAQETAGTPNGVAVGGVLTWVFDLTVTNGLLDTSLLGAEIQALYLDANGLQIGALTNENITLQGPNPPSSPVPEPATLLLLGTGLGAVAARRRLKKRA